MMFPFTILNRWQLKRIADYKYESESTTLLDPILQVYWRWLVEKLPMWLAPNVLTSSGLAINMATFLVVMSYCPLARGELPSWVFVICAVGLFLYQTLDALDGKQWWRTGREESPLEELTDHAADCISLVFLVLQISVALQLGNTPAWLFFFCFSGVFLFYCFHWQVYVTGIIRFGMIDVTELQVGAIGIFLTTAKYGTSVWAIQVPYLEVQLKVVCLWTVVLGVMYAACRLSCLVYQFWTKSGCTWQGYRVLTPLLPATAMLSMTVIVARSSPTNLLENHPCLFVLMFGLVFSKLTIKLMITCLSKAPAEMTDVLLLVGMVQILNAQFGSWFDEYTLMCVMLTWVVLDLVYYSWVVCNDICAYCNLRFFSLGPREKRKEVVD